MANEHKFGNPIIAKKKLTLDGVDPLLLVRLATDPASGMAAGDLYYNTTSNVCKFYNGSAWVTITTGTISLTGQTLAEKSIIIGNASNLSAAVDTSSLGDIEATTASGLQIKALAVGEGEIASSAVTSGKIASNAVGGAKFRLENDTYLRARNAADSADVNIVKVNASNAIEFASLPYITSSVPTDDSHAANKKYVDDRVSGLAWKEVVLGSSAFVNGSGNSAGIRPGHLLRFANQPVVGDTVSFSINGGSSNRTYTFVADQGSESAATDVSIESSAVTAMARLALRINADASRIVDALDAATTVLVPSVGACVGVYLKSGTDIPTTGQCGTYGTFTTAADLQIIDWANGAAESSSWETASATYENNFSFGRRASALVAQETHPSRVPDRVYVWDNDTSAWTYMSTPGDYSAGDGISISAARAISNKLSSTGGLEHSSTYLQLKLDSTGYATLSMGSAGVRVANGGIKDTQVASDAAIAISKLAALTAYRLLVSNASGVIAPMASAGTAGQVLSSAGAAAEVTWSSGVNFTAPGTDGTAPAWAAESSGTRQLQIPLAATAAVTAGLISKTQYDTFNAKANAALNNLASVSINESLISDTDNTDDLGSDAIEWKDAWIHSIKHNDAADTDLAISVTGNNGSIVITPHGTGLVNFKSAEVRRSEGPSSTDFISEKYFDALTLAANTSSWTTIASLSYAKASYEGCIIEYKIKEATSLKVRIGTLVVANDNDAAISAADQFSETAVLGDSNALELQAIINGSNVEIQFKNTHASNACTMRCDVKKIRA